MARRVFLHIGAPKTGTTYLQSVMWDNRPALRAQGVLYPGQTRMDHHNATLKARGAPMQSRPEHVRDAWDRLTAEVREWPDTAILTHEFYALADADQAAAAIAQLAPAEVHLVFTARDYVRAIPAYWQESLKIRDPEVPDSFGEFTQAMLDGSHDGPWSWQTLDAVEVLDRWAKTLPAERVHVVTVPQPGAPKSLLWERFATLLGIDPDGFDANQATANESLGAAEAEVLRRVKRALPEEFRPLKVRYEWIRSRLAHGLLVPLQGQRFGLRPEQAEQFRALSVSCAEQLAQRGYDVRGDLQELVPDTLPDLMHPDDVSESDVLDSSVTALAQLLARHRRVVLERDGLKRALHESETSLRARVRRLPRRIARRMLRRG